MIPRNLLFEQSKSTEIYCSVCKNIPLDPVQCSNITCSKFLYCLGCLDQNKCPNCKNHSSIKKLAGTLRPKIKGLRFYCPNNKYGCQEIIEYEYYPTHTKNCKYSKSTTPEPTDKYLHKRQPSFTIASCQTCGAKFEESEKATHDCRAALRQDVDELRRVISYLKLEDPKKKIEECLNDVNSLKDRVKCLEMQMSIALPNHKKAELLNMPDETSTSKSLGDKELSKLNSNSKKTKSTKSNSKLDQSIHKNKLVKSEIVYSNYGGGLVCGNIAHSAFLKTNQNKAANLSSMDKILCSYKINDLISTFGDSLGQLSFYEPSLNKVSTMKIHSKAITSILQRFGSNDIITGSIDNTIALVSTDKRRVEKTYKIGRAAISFEILNNKKILYSSEDKFLYNLDLDTGNMQSQYGPFNEVIIDILSLGNKLMMSCLDKSIYIYDLEKNKLINHWNADVQLFIPSEHLLQMEPNVFVCPSSNNSINLWDIDGNKISQLKGHTGNIRKIMAYKSNKFVSCAEDGKMIIWSTQGKLFSFNDTQGITTFC